MRAPARLQCWARHVSKTFAHAHAPGKTVAHSRDASIPAEYGNLQHLRAVISSGHVCHVDRDARAHYFACIYHVAHNARDGRYDHDDDDYPDRVFPGYNGYIHT
jgi:hypothetical protein